jgi:hypothetical protein
MPAWAPLTAVAAGLLASGLSGCGVNQPVQARTTAVGALAVSPNTIAFGSVTVGQTATSQLTASNSGSTAIEVSNIQLAGGGFSITNAPALPVTVAAGSSLKIALVFSPTAAGAASGTVSVTSDAGGGNTSTVKLSGTGVAASPTTQAAALSSLTCTSGSITGAGTDNCTVTLTAAAPTGGLAVTLASSNTHVTVPASVTVAAGTTSATFTAAASAVSTATAATLTAAAGSVSKTYTIDLGAVAAPAALSALTCTAGSITGAGTDNCMVTLTAGAPEGGLAVALASSTGNVTVPASVTVAAGASSATFAATASAVSTATPATLTATAGGESKTYTIDLNAIGLSALTCNSGSITGAGTVSCAVTLTAGAPAGGLVVTLASSTADVTVPASVAVAASATSVTFTATVAAASTPTIATLTAVAGNVSKTYTIDLDITAALSALTCASGSITGAGTDICTVMLTAGAASSGFRVALASSSTNVTVPALATVPGGASSTTFTATASAVTTATAVTLTATGGSVSKTYTIDLGAASPGIQLGSASVAFGNVTVNSPATQSVQIISSGTAPLTISAGRVTGAGFSMPGVSFPITLNPGSQTTLELQFDPTATGSASGTVTLTTNTASGTATIGLTGTGAAAAYSVKLSWEAPTNSSVPVASYEVFRAVSGATYSMIGTTSSGTTQYTDSSVADGTTYLYYVVSVDTSNNVSTPSNTWTAVIP